MTSRYSCVLVRRWTYHWRCSCLWRCVKGSRSHDRRVNSLFSFKNLWFVRTDTYYLESDPISWLKAPEMTDRFIKTMRIRSLSSRLLAIASAEVHHDIAYDLPNSILKFHPVPAFLSHCYPCDYPSRLPLRCCLIVNFDFLATSCLEEYRMSFHRQKNIFKIFVHGLRTSIILPGTESIWQQEEWREDTRLTVQDRNSTKVTKSGYWTLFDEKNSSRCHSTTRTVHKHSSQDWTTSHFGLGNHLRQNQK